jgi:hypothetical protein
VSVEFGRDNSRARDRIITITRQGPGTECLLPTSVGGTDATDAEKQGPAPKIASPADATDDADANSSSFVLSEKEEERE